MIKAVVFDAYGTLFDVQSVADATERAYPGRGEYITQVWRQKQLEYSWLRALMGRYADFWGVTREALAYTLGTLGLEPDESFLADMAQAYNRLTPYPDAAQCLAELAPLKRAILSNGAPDMLQALVANAGLTDSFDAVISVDAKRVFKPHPDSYALVEEVLGVTPAEVLFVSSNGFDVGGAKNFGFSVARVARLSQEALARELVSGTIAPLTMFKALRMREETYAEAPDFVVPALGDLPRLVRGMAGAHLAPAV
uniref:(S)-2-haloacid dehalogenase n=1 Tax=Xanthobacter autotrophicus TaxID=280 RepID=HAD_XANAU|nr:RecName: Full=(S)-2-haloacid dehalogenase; AltName: Full=2-haloalkanoic acid dehalogenase; AltName: Full=Halocarboxylic acid halidohydrolase; AltName: Full=L-2-haloacid dehalogenase [Xanthobacter autotrophicus]1AQ6_A Chain A, L-2-HALOACID DEHALOGENASE [Xanthobacter autotrophicus]1AQ6_B Chain B, L-2-HALOACID DEHALOGENASE [Xanthobacter autotrophicus]